MSLLKNLSAAKKNIIYNYKRYLCFFVMLFLIQTLFASVLVLYSNNNSNELEYLEEKYNYHLQLQNLNDEQFYYLLNAEQGEVPFFEVIKGTQTNISGTNSYRYDIYIKFITSDVKSGYESYKAKYYPVVEEEGDFKELLTPLYTYESELALNTFICALTCLFIFVCGCVIIYLLDSIMVNHYKFLYGIYMTFGASFKKLFKTAFSEMFVLSATAFLPSQLITNIACFFILRGSAQSFRVDVLSIFLSFLLCVSVAALPVFFNIKSVSKKTPLNLIGAVDNANLIISPRTSADIMDYVFPGKLEVLSVMRFRKYGIKLVASAVSFAALFLCCAYLGISYSETLDVKRPEYTIRFSSNMTKEDEKNDEDGADMNDGSSFMGPIDDIFENGDENETEPEQKPTYDFTYTDEVRDYFYTFDGVEKIIKDCHTDAIDINSHIKLPKGKAKLFGGAENENGERCYNNVKFTALDSEVKDIIEYYGYEVEGDLDKVINDGAYVAITYGYGNMSKFKLSIGDKIYIATGSTQNKSAQYISNDYSYIMGVLLESYDYTYTEYTVGAIIKDMPVGEEFPVYMNGDTYAAVTGNDMLFTDVDIIIDSDITDETYASLERDLRHAADYYTNMVIQNNDYKTLIQIEKNKNYLNVYMFVAAVLLSVSPLLWFFSQILFYLKRRPEFDMYFSFGASKSKIKKAFIIDGIVFCIFAAVVYTLLAIIMSMLLTVFLNSQLYSASTLVKFEYSLPAIPYVIGLFVTCVSAFFSSYVPYMTYIKSCHPIFTGNSFDGKQEIISEGEKGI